MTGANGARQALYYNEFTNRLLDREEFIWSGRPATGLLFTGQDIFLIPFSLLWGGIVLFGAFATLTQTKEQPGFPAHSIPR